MESKTTFAPKDAIYLTVQAATPPRNKQVTIVVLDDHDEEMKTIWGDMKDGKAMTAPLRNLPGGRYTANASVDKKQICKVSFEIQ